MCLEMKGEISVTTSPIMILIILHINIGKNYMASIIEAYRYVHIGKLLSNDAIIAEADVLPYRHGSSRLWGIH